MNGIYILLGYARSGITLLNRVLSSDGRLICLSEINSRFICPTEPNLPHLQLKQWYGIDIARDTILDEIKESACRARDLNKILVIRDWSFGSFVPLKYNNFMPTNSLNTVDDLERLFGSQLPKFAMVRNPIDVWLSMRDSVKAFHDIHLQHLKQFIAEVNKRHIPILKYEEFCARPDETLSKIYNIVGTEKPDSIFLSSKATGDINYLSSSRGGTSDKICCLPRRNLSEQEVMFLRNNTCAKEISAILSYINEIL